MHLHHLLLSSAVPLPSPAPAAARGTESVGPTRHTDLTPMRREVIEVGKPSKAALSKAGSTLASSGSSKSSKSKAGSTLGKG
jgi:hypothetical protein